MLNPENELHALLEPIHYGLQSVAPDYVALGASGSTITGDRWVRGYSDRDVIVVFKREIAKRPAVAALFSNPPFDDTLNLVPVTEALFLTPGNVAAAFGNRFRCKSLFGEALVSQVQLPTSECAKQFAKSALCEPSMGTIARIERKYLDINFWSEGKIRHSLYALLKDAFTSIAILHYVETGEYLPTRRALAERIGEPALIRAFQSINAIESVDRNELISAAENLAVYLREAS